MYFYDDGSASERMYAFINRAMSALCLSKESRLAHIQSPSCLYRVIVMFVSEIRVSEVHLNCSQKIADCPKCELIKFKLSLNDESGYIL